jgi:signal transduction histidine kinase
MTLYQKGLLVIGIPLLLQLVCLGIFAHLLEQTESLEKQDYRSKAVIGQSNWEGALLSCSMLSGTMYAITHNAQYLDTNRQLNHALADQQKGIAQTVADDPSQVDLVKRADALIAKINATTDEITRMPGDQQIAEAAKRSADMQSLWNQLYEIRHDLLKVENTRYRSDSDLLPQHRRFLKLMLFCLMGTTVVFAAYLIRAYNQGITKRLAIMADNAVRFVRKEPLQPVVYGQDEVAALDRTFHDMAKAVSAAEKQKQEYLAMLNHDLRSPLTAALGSIDLIKAGGCGVISEKADTVLSRAQRNTKDVLELINEILEIEKYEAGMLTLQRDYVSLKSLAEKAVDSLKPLAEQKHIDIRLVGADGALFADGDRLKRTMVNLIANALKFSPNDSEILVNIDEVDGGVSVEVQDHGPGIAPEKQSEIFERFRQANAEDSRKQAGVGLGLSICKAFVEAHGGKIDVRSELGKGSTFWFYIPGAVDGAADAAVAGSTLELEEVEQAHTS